MPPRQLTVESYAAALRKIMERLRRVEEAQTRRLLPPGYVFSEQAGNLVIERVSDGSTATLVFT